MIVKNSRILIGILIGVSFLFILVGIFLFIANQQGNFLITPDKIIIFYLFIFFAIGCGGIIFVSQIKNLLHPFTMITITPEGFSFAIGSQYEQKMCNWKDIANVETVPNEQLRIMGKNPVTNLIVTFKQTTSLPASLTTSAGVQYTNYSLVIDGLYMDTPAETILTEMKKYFQ